MFLDTTTTVYSYTSAGTRHRPLTTTATMCATTCVLILPLCTSTKADQRAREDIAVAALLQLLHALLQILPLYTSTTADQRAREDSAHHRPVDPPRLLAFHFSLFFLFILIYIQRYSTLLLHSTTIYV